MNHKKVKTELRCRKSIQRLMVLGMLTAGSLGAYAQNTVTGTVVDASGEPLIGASVQVKGTKSGAVTDLDGHFTISNVKDGSDITISYVGYTSQTVTLKGSAPVTVTLQEDNQMLNDVVVIGYGSVKKSDLTSAVSKMSGEAIKDRPLARAEQALQGQLAGVQTRATSGEPGTDLQIRVRGAASVNASSDPLYVVDGVPMTSISALNPSDIQSMEVLKDAASAAIYGSRGSNGVVIVTTKRGKNGKPTVTFNATVGFQRPEKKLDVMTAREWMEFKTRWNDANYLKYCNEHGITGRASRTTRRRDWPMWASRPVRPMPDYTSTTTDGSSISVPRCRPLTPIMPMPDSWHSSTGRTRCSAARPSRTTT